MTTLILSLLALLLLVASVVAFASILYCAVARCPGCGDFHCDDEEERLCALEQLNAALCRPAGDAGGAQDN